MSAETIARWQFGITTVYHFIFVPLMIGLAPAIAAMKPSWSHCEPSAALARGRGAGRLPRGTRDGADGPPRRVGVGYLRRTQLARTGDRARQPRGTSRRRRRHIHEGRDYPLAGRGKSCGGWIQRRPATGPQGRARRTQRVRQVHDYGLLARVRGRECGHYRGRRNRPPRTVWIPAAVTLGLGKSAVAHIRHDDRRERPGRGPRAADDQVRDDLRRAQLGDWIDLLPAGIDTRVGQFGSMVSGGQRQRIALARILLADRPPASTARPRGLRWKTSLPAPKERRCWWPRRTWST